MIACTKEKIASDITNIIGTKVRFKSEEKRGELPIQFLGLFDDYNGVDINQTDSFIEMSAKRYFERFLASHGWDVSSDKVDEAFQDCMKSSKPLAPLPMDSISQLFNQEGPRENTSEFHALEKASGFSYRTVLGEMMYLYITARPDIGFAITTLSKFSSCPSAYHYSKLKGVTKYLQSTIGWGIRFKRPKKLEHIPKGEKYVLVEIDEFKFPVNILSLIHI